MFKTLGSKEGDLVEAKPFKTEEAIFNRVCMFFVLSRVHKNYRVGWGGNAKC